MDMVNIQNRTVYRWYIVASGLCLMALSIGVINNCFALFTIPVTEELGFTRREFAVNQTLLFVTTMTVTPRVGTVIRKTGLLKGLRIAAVLLAVVYFCYALATRLWQFYVISALLGVLMPFVTTVPLSILVGEWFERDLGLALGIVFMGSGIGGMVFNPVATLFIQKASWRFAFGAIAVMMLLILVPLVFLVIKEAPKDRPADQRTTSKAKVNEPARLTGESFAKDLKTIRFWAYMLMGLLMGAGTYTIINFTSTYLQDTGYSAYFAATVTAISMGGMAVGKLFLGKMYDFLGVRITSLISALFLALGMLGASFMGWPGAVVLIVLGGSLGCPLGTIAPPLLIRRIFGTRAYSDKLSLMVACDNLGAAITPIIAGALYEYTGSYCFMYRLLLLVMLVLLVCLAVLLPGKDAEL